jgi:hypothetical protein
MKKHDFIKKDARADMARASNFPERPLLDGDLFV